MYFMFWEKLFGIVGREDVGRRLYDLLMIVFSDFWFILMEFE